MFPPNPKDGQIYEVKSGIFYTYDAALKTWYLTTGSIPEPASTDLSNGLMTSEDYVKILNYPTNIKETSITSDNCATEYVTGNVDLLSGDRFLEIASTAQFTASPILPPLPIKISNNTYAIDFSLNLPNLAQELKARGQYIATGPSGARGHTGATGPRGYDNIPSGPSGQQGARGTAPTCNITSAPEILTATGASERVITNVEIVNNIDNTYNLIVNRELLSNLGSAVQFVKVNNEGSNWLVVTNNPNPGAHQLYYIDIEPIINTITDKFNAELALLKAGYENVTEYWLKTMSVLYDQQRQALCCALERCLSVTKNDGARQHMESVAASAAGTAKIQLNPRCSPNVITVGGDTLNPLVGQSSYCAPGDGFGGGGIVPSSTTATTGAPPTTIQPPGGIVPPGWGGGSGNGGAATTTTSSPQKTFCVVNDCGVDVMSGVDFDLQLYTTADLSRTIPCSTDLQQYLDKYASKNKCFKVDEYWGVGAQCWNGQTIYPVGQNPFSFGIDGTTQGVVMLKYDRDYTYYVPPYTDPQYFSIGKKYNIFIHCGIFCLTNPGTNVKQLYLVFKVADRNGLGSYAEWAISLYDIAHTPINSVTGGFGSATYPGDDLGSKTFSVSLPFVPFVSNPNSSLPIATVNALRDLKLNLNIKAKQQFGGTTQGPSIRQFLVPVGCQGTGYPNGLNGLSATTPMVITTLDTCLELRPLSRGLAAGTYFLALRLKKAKSLGAGINSGNYTIKISTVYNNGYKVNIYSYAIDSNGAFKGIGGIITSFGNNSEATIASPSGSYVSDGFAVDLNATQDYIITITPKQFRGNDNKLYYQTANFYLAVFKTSMINLPACDQNNDQSCQGIPLFPNFSGSEQDYVFMIGD